MSLLNREIYAFCSYPLWGTDTLRPDSGSSTPPVSVRCRRSQFVKGDICSADLVTYVLKEEAIDTILHFAAQTHVDNSFGNSFQFTQNNIYGTHVLLESSKKVGGLPCLLWAVK